MYAEYLEQLRESLQKLEEWRSRYGDFTPHQTVQADTGRIGEVLDRMMERLQGNYPFHHPIYAGQMLKPPHPIAWMAYTLAMTINPNNHALDGGPPTSKMEKETVHQLAGMLGLQDEYMGHLTGGGTMANLEALWVARHEHPGRGIAFSDQAHYTHGRMGELLQLPTYNVESDVYGRMLPERLNELKDRVGTVVVTMGTTGLGSVDPLDDIMEWARKNGIRVHVDAAYGGFFKLLEGDAEFPGSRHWARIPEADSLVIDPHKHGLQPYGCGCILFSDPRVGAYYKHDSPYTYFSSEELHLGEISLECSRAGASAAGLWATLQLLPLSENEGFGPLLRACRNAAVSLYSMVKESDRYRPVQKPELDILGYFPVPFIGEFSTSNISDWSKWIFEEGMNREEEGFYASLFQMDAQKLARLHPDLEIDTDRVTVLRSVLMKPEHENFAADLYRRLEEVHQACVERF